MGNSLPFSRIRIRPACCSSDEHPLARVVRCDHEQHRPGEPAHDLLELDPGRDLGGDRDQRVGAGRRGDHRAGRRRAGRRRAGRRRCRVGRGRRRCPIGAPPVPTTPRRHTDRGDDQPAPPVHRPLVVPQPPAFANRLATKHDVSRLLELPRGRLITQSRHLARPRPRFDIGSAAPDQPRRWHAACSSNATRTHDMQMSAFIAAGYGNAKNKNDLRHYFEYSSHGVDVLEDGLKEISFGEYLVDQGDRRSVPAVPRAADAGPAARRAPRRGGRRPRLRPDRGGRAPVPAVHAAQHGRRRVATTAPDLPGPPRAGSSHFRASAMRAQPIARITASV